MGLEEQAAHRDRRAPLAKEPCVWGTVRPSSGQACGERRRHVAGSVGLAEEWTVTLLKGRQAETPTPIPTPGWGLRLGNGTRERTARNGPQLRARGSPWNASSTE